MKVVNQAQLKLIAEFFANMAVVWFAAAFIAPIDQQVFLKSSINGLVAFVSAIFLLKEVKEA